MMLGEHDVVMWRAGEVIFERNDRSDAFYYIRSGRVRIELGDLVLGELGPGATLGELGLLEHEARTARARAMEETEALRVSAADYEQVLQNRPEVLRSLLRSLTQCLRRCTDLLEQTAHRAG
jgi:CRP-like cAMP-binding protein